MDVIIYSTPTCPWCIKAKEFFKTNKVAFKDIDVSKDQEAAKVMVEKSGQMGVPVIDANGKILVGFNEAELKSALGLK